MSTSAAPWAMPSVPRVATNGGMPSRTTSSPLATPNAMPDARTARTSAAIRLPPLASSIASTTPARPSTAPIDRSRPSLMMIERHRQREQQQRRRLHADVEEIRHRREAWIEDGKGDQPARRADIRRPASLPRATGSRASARWQILARTDGRAESRHTVPGRGFVCRGSA